jgi:hypothetical protein
MIVNSKDFEEKLKQEKGKHREHNKKFLCSFISLNFPFIRLGRLSLHARAVSVLWACETEWRHFTTEFSRCDESLST